jgi:carbonic anhydrase
MKMNTQTKQTQQSLTPKDARQILVEGNKRFVQNMKAQRNLNEQVAETSKGQFPFAVILSCIDSRVPVELVFDQGIGDIFSVRVAGNVINDDVLGSIEYGCKVAGSKLVLVLGHTKCGAVNAACNHVELGNITTLLKKIKPAVDIVQAKSEVMSDKAIEDVAILNVKLSIARIRNESPILAEMEEDGQIEIVGASYAVETGEVRFF